MADEEKPTRKRATAEDKERAQHQQLNAFRLRVARELMGVIWREAEWRGDEKPLRDIERAIAEQEKKLLGSP
jgi:hypothetical protein